MVKINDSNIQSTFQRVKDDEKGSKEAKKLINMILSGKVNDSSNKYDYDYLWTLAKKASKVTYEKGKPVTSKESDEAWKELCKIAFSVRDYEYANPDHSVIEFSTENLGLVSRIDRFEPDSEAIEGLASQFKGSGNKVEDAKAASLLTKMNEHLKKMNIEGFVKKNGNDIVVTVDVGSMGKDFGRAQTRIEEKAKELGLSLKDIVSEGENTIFVFGSKVSDSLEQAKNYLKDSWFGESEVLKFKVADSDIESLDKFAKQLIKDEGLDVEVSCFNGLRGTCIKVTHR